MINTLKTLLYALYYNVREYIPDLFLFKIESKNPAGTWRRGEQHV